MRWTKKTKINKDYRIVKRFALFPIRVNNEFRWLETCYIVQKCWYDWDERGWDNETWTDKITYLRWKQNRELCCCAETTCKYNRHGKICMIGHGAVITNNGICYSKEEE